MECRRTRIRPDSPGQYADYFPGLEYTDALAVDLRDTPFPGAATPSWPASRSVK